MKMKEMANGPDHEAVIDLDPLGIGKYDRILEKYTRIVSATVDDNNHNEIPQEQLQQPRQISGVVMASDDMIEIEMTTNMNNNGKNNGNANCSNHLIDGPEQASTTTTTNHKPSTTSSSSSRRGKMDPPEEYSPPSSSRPAVASRDDDNITRNKHYSGTGSYREPSSSSSSSRPFSFSSPTTNEKHYDNLHSRESDMDAFHSDPYCVSRNRINSKLEMFNAKSRAFKEFLEREEEKQRQQQHFSPSLIHSRDKDSCISHSTAYSTHANENDDAHYALSTSISPNNGNFNASYSHSHDDSHESSTDDIDARLERITKRIAEIRESSKNDSGRRNTSTPANAATATSTLTSTNNDSSSASSISSAITTSPTSITDKKLVSFSEFGILRDGSGKDKSVLLCSGKELNMDMLKVKNRSMRSKLLVKNNNNSNNNNSDSNRSVAENGGDGGGSSNNSRGKVLAKIKEIMDKSHPSLTAKGQKLEKGLAMTVLSEKILDGHIMTRSHCARCGMSLLLSQDDTVVCVCCPLITIRSNIRKSVAKTVLATNVIEGCTINHENLCDSCHSPKVTNKDENGPDVCKVCPVLDAASVAIVRAESKGSVMIESVCHCGARKMRNKVGNESCVVCSFVFGNMGVVMSKVSKEYKSSGEAMGEGDWAAMEELYPSPSMKSMSSCDTSVIRNNGNNDLPVQGFEWEDEPGAFGVAVAVETNELVGKKSAEGGVVQVSEENSKTGQDQEVESKSTIVEAPSDPSQLGAPPNSIEPVQDESNAGVGGAVADAEPASVPEGDTLSQEGKSMQADGTSPAKPSSSNFVSGAMALASLQDQLKAEIGKAKQWQATLDKTIGKSPVPEMSIPDIGVSEEENAMATTGSFSVSQQEVEGGIVKEYIPPTNYFFHKGIPSEVIVDHMPDESVAQSYHTNHLKNTEKIQTKSSKITDCFGFSKKPKKVAFEETEDNFDDMTIDTDEYTVDYTLNTLDDSKMDQSTTVQRYDVLEEAGDKKGDNDESSSSAICCFTTWFSCGSNNSVSDSAAEEKVDLEKQDRFEHDEQDQEQREKVQYTYAPLIYGDSYSLASIPTRDGGGIDPPSVMDGEEQTQMNLVRDDSGFTENESFSLSRLSFGSKIPVDAPEQSKTTVVALGSNANGESDSVKFYDDVRRFVAVQKAHKAEQQSAATKADTQETSKTEDDCDAANQPNNPTQASEHYVGIGTAAKNALTNLPSSSFERRIATATTEGNASNEMSGPMEECDARLDKMTKLMEENDPAEKDRYFVQDIDLRL